MIPATAEDRSPSIGIGGHVRSERPVTFKRNQQSTWSGIRTQGVGERTAVLPEGWRDRLIRIENPNTRGVAGLCLEVHDLAISKHVAGREKDLEFTRELALHGMTDSKTLALRLKETELHPELRKLIEARIRRDSAHAKKR